MWYYGCYFFDCEDYVVVYEYEDYEGDEYVVEVCEVDVEVLIGEVVGDDGGDCEIL